MAIVLFSIMFVPALAQEKDPSETNDDSLRATIIPDHPEILDAGNLPGTAQDVTGVGSLNSIAGVTSTVDQQDMFRICITDPGGFSATTELMANFDTQLFLFDNNGLGIYSNDDTPAALGFQSTLPAGDINSPTTPGIYFIAIDGFDGEPEGAGGEIFQNTIAGANPPTGPGGPGPITTWQPDVTSGDYVISLTGAAGTTNCGAVGGELIPLDTSALLLAGAQMNAAWMIPVIVSAIGIGIVIARKF